MIQADVKTHLDARTQLDAPQRQPDGSAQKSPAGPFLYAAAIAAVYLLRRQLFSSGALLFAAGFYTAKKVKTKQVTTAFQGLVQVQETMTINRSAEDLYAMWHDIESAPKFMEGVRQVTKTGDTTSHWVMSMRGGRTLEWDSEVTAREPGKRLAWRTIGDPVVPSAGQIAFEPAASGRGTVVRINQEFLLPGGRLAAALGGVFSRTPGGYVRENLRHFKQLAEAGEIATTRGQSHGTRSAGARVQQAATGDREQQATVPQTGAIAHQEVAQ